MANELNVIEMEGKHVVDSREVAEMTGKKHNSLLRDIRKYIGYMGTKLDSSLFFVESEYEDAYGRKKSCYLITRRGCDMVANKLTGEKGVIFTATYVNKFEEMKEENKQLQQDNKELHTIATSDDEQAKRKYEADKVRYSWKNLRGLLENSTYKNIEDEVRNIIEFHSNVLKKKDRCDYDSHQKANKTTYKQLVRDRVHSVLDEIYNTTLDGTLRTVVGDVKESILLNKIATTNRSDGKKISQLERQVKKMPKKDDYITLNYHPFSVNYQFEHVDGKTVKTRAYNNWINNFPVHELPSIEHWNIDVNKPIEVFVEFTAKPNFDTDNFTKSLQDMIWNRVYGVDDNIVTTRYSSRVGTCDDYKDGKIRLFIQNMSPNTNEVAC